MVVPGMTIGLVGDTGDSDGTHLHFEVRTEPPGESLHANRGSAINPSGMLGAFTSGTVTAGRYAEHNDTQLPVPYIPGETDDTDFWEQEVNPVTRQPYE